MEDMILIHWGNKGQRWGTRNYRNYDGTLTEEGKKRYDYYENKTDRVYQTARAKQAGPKTYLKTSRWGELQENLANYSNAELKALTERARLEREYREAFNTKQYTTGRKLLNGFKTSARELADVANAGKTLLNAMQGIKESLDQARGYEEKKARQANKRAEQAKKEADKIIGKENDQAAKDWLLSIDNWKTRKNAQDFLKSFSGNKGSNYSSISKEQLEKIKKLYQ